MVKYEIVNNKLIGETCLMLVIVLGRYRFSGNMIYRLTVHSLYAVFSLSFWQRSALHKSVTIKAVGYRMSFYDSSLTLWSKSRAMIYDC